MTRSLILWLLACSPLLLWASSSSMKAPIEDGAYGEDCRAIWNPGAPGVGPSQLTCNHPCGSGCSEEHSGTNPTRYYCRCAGNTAEPECCHLYREDYGGGIWAGPYAEGQCGGEECNGAIGDACDPIPIDVPFGEPPKKKAVCH